MRITEVSPATTATIVSVLSASHDKACATLTAEASWERLTDFFLDKLRHSATTLVAGIGVEWATAIVEWARAGHPAADRALRAYGREMGERSRFDEMLVAIRAYCLEMSGKPFAPFPHGKNVVGNMMRDIWIPMVLDDVAAATGMPATRSAANPAPSVAFFMAQMAKKKGIKLKEQQISRIYWRRDRQATAIEDSMPKLFPAP